MSFKIISISLGATDHVRLNARLKLLGMTRSEYVRKLLREADMASPTTKRRKEATPK